MHIYVLVILVVLRLDRSDAILQSAELIATNIIFRHGDRTPTSSYPKSTNDASSWPNGFGQLTIRGQRQQIHLGQFFRRRYSNLLNKTYVASEITVRSTDYDRTLMSAYSNLLGLYPTTQAQLENIMAQLNENDTWPQSVPWQPIPVHTVPTNIDYMLSNGDCPRLYELVEELQNSDAMNNFKRQYQNFFDLLQSKTGAEVNNLFDAWFVADIIIIENLHNKSPSWVTSDIVQKLIDIENLSFSHLFSLPEVGRLLGGLLAREIMKNFEDTIAKRPNARKARIYSAHDVTLAALLSIVERKQRSKPPYASALFFDLYRMTDNSYSIQLEYHTSFNHPPEPIRMSPCSNTSCPLETLNLWLKDKLPGEDMVQECQQHNSNETPNMRNLHRKLLFLN